MRVMRRGRSSARIMAGGVDRVNGVAYRGLAPAERGRRGGTQGRPSGPARGI